MRVSEHANYLLNEYGRLQFDYAAYCKPDGEPLRNEARNNLETYIAELESARRWRVVADGELPDDDVEVFVLLYGSSVVSTGKHYRNARHLDLEDNSYNLNYVIGDYWLIGDDEITYAQHCYNAVTHWMPLPSAPESEGK